MKIENKAINTSADKDPISTSPHKALSNTIEDELDYDLDLVIKSEPHTPIQHPTQGCTRQCGSGPCTGNCTNACSVRCPTQSHCCDPNR